MARKPTGNPRGRPRKPTKLKMLENSRVTDFPTNEPRPTVGLPECPQHLSPAARQIWNRQGPELAQMGLITHIDEASFGLYCIAYAEQASVELMMQKVTPIYKHPQTENIVVNPLVWVAYRLRDQVMKYGRPFGLSPEARSGISVETRNEANPYREWRQRKRALLDEKKKKKTT